MATMIGSNDCNILQVSWTSVHVQGTAAFRRSLRKGRQYRSTTNTASLWSRPSSRWLSENTKLRIKIFSTYMNFPLKRALWCAPEYLKSPHTHIFIWYSVNPLFITFDKQNPHSGHKRVKNTSKYRCFSECHMHKLPRLNDCGLSSERLYFYLSADEIFLNYNEPFYRNVSLNLVRSRHISKIIIKYAPWSRCFDEHQMHKLPRLNSCGTSRDGDIIIYLLTKKNVQF